MRWIPIDPIDGAEALPGMWALIDAIGDVRDLRSVRDDQGGLKRLDVVRALSPRWQRAGYATLPDSYVDAQHTDTAIGVRVEAGRAHTNNDGLVAVLEAAIDPSLRALLLIVPEDYKRSSTAPKVEMRLRRLVSNERVTLDLLGVGLISY